MRRLARTWSSLAAIGTAGAVVCLVTFANLASGAVRIENGRPVGRITVVAAKLSAAKNLAAGDRDDRIFDLKLRRGHGATLIVTAPTSPLTDRSLGLRLRIDRCSKTWRVKGSSYTCAGKVTAVAIDSPALGKHKLRKLRKGRNHLRVRLTLPQSASNALQGQSVRLLYKFR